MSGLDVLEVLRKQDGLDKHTLYDRVSHLVNTSTFDKNIKSLLKSKEVMKIERTKYDKGVRRLVIRFYLLE